MPGNRVKPSGGWPGSTRACTRRSWARRRVCEGSSNRNGRLGYILPHKFFNAKYGQPVRELIFSGRHLSEVVHFGDAQVFTGATTYTALLFLEKSAETNSAS